MERVRQAVARAIGRPVLTDELALRPLAPHQSNQLYDVVADGRHLIAKEFLLSDRPQAPLREFAALQRLQHLDLAPQPVFFDAELAPVVVYEFVEGVMWDRRTPSPAELAALAELWLRFQHINPDGLWLAFGDAPSVEEHRARLLQPFQRYVDWSLRQPAQLQQVARMCLEECQRILRLATPVIAMEEAPRCFCRSDPRFANVISRPDGRLALIDWEDSGLRDPAREAADLLLHPNQEDLLSRVEWEAFLLPYRAGHRADAGFERRLQGYLGLFSVFWLGLLLSVGTRENREGWLINAMQPQVRLRRYLARARAWPDAEIQLSELEDLQFF